VSLRIEQLRIKNFRAFSDVTLADLPPMVFFVGANGSGKSTLFDVFGFMRDALVDNVEVAIRKPRRVLGGPDARRARESFLRGQVSRR
jgi:predicted ATPase